MRAHRYAPRRHCRPLADALRRVGEEAFEDRGAQARPDQAFGNVRVRGVELMQVRVRLPLLEAEFDLPAEPIESGDQIQGERRARQIGAQPRHRRVAPRQDHDAEADKTGPAPELHIEVHALAGVLGEETRQPDRRRHGGTMPPDPCRPDPGIIAARQAHDEGAPVRGDRLEVGHAGIAAVREAATDP